MHSTLPTTHPRSQHLRSYEPESQAKNNDKDRFVRRALAHRERAEQERLDRFGRFGRR